MSTDFVESRIQPRRGAAKKAALEGPVFITDRGRPSHVLLSLESYHSLIAKQSSIVDLLAMPGLEDIAFKPCACERAALRPASLLMYLLDTNVVSELRKARTGKADARVAAWGSGNARQRDVPVGHFRAGARVGHPARRAARWRASRPPARLARPTRAAGF